MSEGFKKRLIEEFDALEARVVNLGLFIGSTQYVELELIEKEALDDQYLAMKLYMNILSRRIDRLLGAE